jgi:sugar phosphate isomerase/epimerase
MDTARSSGRLAVCSWSLLPSSAADLTLKVRACGVSRVQLALDPIRESTGRDGWGESATRRAIDDAGIEVVSGMMAPRGEDYATLASIRETGGVRPDETWEQNRGAARENAAIARRMGLTLVTMHAGCVPDATDDPLRARMIARLREIAEIFGEHGMRVAFETGQDSASTMLGLLEQLHDLDVGVNFDPANVLLYGSGDPIETMRALSDRIVQTHVKDATRSRVRGEWGVEVRAGTGEVRWDEYFGVLASLPRKVDVVIEREAGASRVEDVRAGVELARRHMEDHA